MIWCVEDDASIRDIELYALTSTGFEARGFDDAGFTPNEEDSGKRTLATPISSCKKR